MRAYDVGELKLKHAEFFTIMMRISDEQDIIRFVF